ncbi:MAG: poly(R)-hydroxyalkanoic acid synthase subunit PhaE [Bacteroidota bacterium]|nr:poly(R)-hydroxyalkanoic acid synthase subunit PhaE [Bacteroidota bacterium]
MSKNTTESSKSFFETVIDQQKQMFDNVKTSTEQFGKQFKPTNAPFEQGQEFFQKWYDKQKDFYNNMNTKGFKVDMKNEEYQELFNGWLGTQMDLFKNFIGTYQHMSKDGIKNMPPFSQLNGMSQDWTGLYNKWNETMNQSWSGMTGNFQNGDLKNSFTNMVGNANNYLKFMEMWGPIIKLLNTNSFDTKQFQSLFNMDAYKSMMDNMFNLMPGMKDLSGNSKNMMDQWTKQGTEQMNNLFGNASNPFANMFAGNNNNNMMGSWMDNYKNMYETMQNAAAPLAKMMTPGPGKNMMEDSSRINNMMVHFGMQNAQMQQHIYNTGLKASQTVAETWSKKMQKGEKFDNPMALYTEWLSINDKVFVELFESKEYSNLQSDLSANGMKLKKEIDLQTEKMMANLPIITRSEMDELYKTIYELKKRVREMEKVEVTKATETKTVVTPTEKTATKTAATLANKPVAKKGK